MNKVIPIWKDHIIESDYDGVYEIKEKYGNSSTGEAIFKGQAYTFPSNKSEINVTRVVENYLEPISNPFNAVAASSSGEHSVSSDNYQIMRRYAVNTESNTLLSNDYYVYDYTYEEKELTTDATCVNNFIYDYVPLNSKVFVTVRKPYNNTSTVTIRRRRGSNYKNLITSSTRETLFFTIEINSNDFAEGDVIQYVIDGTSYNLGTVKDVCGKDYVLHYLNRQGAWDSMVINGKVVETEKYKRTTYSRFVTVQSKDHSERLLSTEVQVQYKLNTDYLNEVQSRKFVREVCSTPSAYLEVRETREVIPIKIESTSMEIKDKRRQYTLNVVTTNKEYRK